MVRSKFPGKPSKQSSRTRVNVLSGSLNNNNSIPVDDQSDGCNKNGTSDALTNQDGTVIGNSIVAEEEATHSLAAVAEADLMRVRLTRGNFAGERALACSNRAASTALAKTVGKFVLPSRSVHSSRVIKPNKRFITVDTSEMQSYKTRVIKKRQCIQKKRTRPILVNNHTSGDLNSDSVIEGALAKRPARRISGAKSIGREEGRNSGMTTRNRIVLRQARLKIQTSTSTSRLGPFSSGNKPGTITCGVCLIPRFFNKRTFLQSDFNIYSCEACSKFIVSIASQKTPSELACRRFDGKCYETKAESTTEPRGRSMRNKNAALVSPLKRLHRSTTNRRCRACWLKICLRSFQMPMALRASLTKMLPNLMQERNLFGGTVSLPANFLNHWYSSQSEQLPSTQWLPFASCTPERPKKRPNKLKASPCQPQRQRYHRVVRDKTIHNLAPNATTAHPHLDAPLIPLMDAATKRQQMVLKGPRVKHVCRRASVVLGHPVATFPQKGNSALVHQSETDSEDGDDPIHDPNVGSLLLPKLPDTMNPSTAVEEEQRIEIPTHPIAPCAVSPKPILEIQHNTNFAKEQHSKEPINATVSIRSDQDEAIAAIAPITKKEKKAQIRSQLDVQYFAPIRKLYPSVPTIPKNVLSIDFWESYDFEEVCRNGFSLTGTAPFPVQAICFLCGSAGIETLLHCCLCCEPYHPYCLEQTPPLFRQPADRFSWLCPRCTTCTACGHADRQKINCQKCHNTYHPHCFNTKWRTDDRPTVCSNCLRCKSCGTDNITKFVGNLALCLLCFKLRNKGNFCPLCQRCYDDNDFDTKMMECGKCNKWVHSKCEGLTDEQYQILSILPETVEYHCCLCSTEQTPYWRKAIQAELKNSFNTILCMLNKNQIARPMLKLTPVKTTLCSNVSTPKDLPASCNVAKRILFSDEKMCDPTIDELRIYSAANIEVDRSSSTSESEYTTAFEVPTTPNIADIKRKINCNEYFSLRDFNNGMERALNASKQLLEIYHNVLRKVFPWFDPSVEESPGMMDMSFADVSKLDINLMERDKKFDYESYAVPIESDKAIVETRSCSLCKGLGDGSPQKEARLLYCGHNEWVHGNCALWSSVVYEEIDGSLQNVHSAINRGKSTKCTVCKLRGASIGCCQKGCPESYHFICAQKAECQFMADSTVYCNHHDTTALNRGVTIDFDIRRSIYVELDNRKKKYIESYKVNYIVGSLSVLNLGLVSASVSDTVDAIIPTSFVCSRLFWSTKSPWQLVPYVIRTSVLKPTSKTLPVDKNFTVDHSQPKQTVDRKLKELSSWLKDEKDVLTRLAEFDDEEEPQNTADILSPELTDAILQELPHGLLDGLMNMDFKNAAADLLDQQQPIQQQRSCSLRLSCKLNSPALKKRKTQAPPPRENVYLHLLVDGPCDSSSGSECGSPEPAVMFDDDEDEEEEDYKQQIASIMHEQPVTCDKCNCTYRTQASYARHLDNCTDPIFTSESDSEEQNQQHIIVCPTTTSVLDVLNVDKKQVTTAMMPTTIITPTYETYSFVPQSETISEYINQQQQPNTTCLPLPQQSPPPDMAFPQQQQPAATYVEPQFTTLPINTFNLSLNQLPLAYPNMNHITIDPSTMNNQLIHGFKTIKSPRATQYITTRKAHNSPPHTLLMQQQPSAQLYIQSLPSNGQLVATMPTFVDSNQIQYVTTNSAPQAAPTTLLQLHQAAADGGGFINLVPNIQSTPLYRLEGGQIVVDNNGSMLWASAPAGTAQVTSAPPQAQQTQPQQPTQQQPQPLFYGFETIVQNTVMQSQQFLPTAMPGVLSSNSSYSTTTQNSFQVFQTSKLEPVLDMSHGGFVLTPTQSTILNTMPPDTMLPQLSFITSQPSQQTAFTEQPQPLPPVLPILRTIKSEPFETTFESPEQRLLLAKMPSARQQSQAMAELTVQTSMVQQIPEIKPVVSRAASSTIPITYSPKSTIKHRPISRVLPMPTNPVKKQDLGPQQYRSKTAKKTAAVPTVKPNSVVQTDMLEVLRQNEEIAKVKQEIIRAKEEIIKAKQEIVKTKEIIIIPMNEASGAGHLAMPSASSPQLLDAPVLPPLAVAKMELASPKAFCLIDDVRKAAQNTFPPIRTETDEPEQKPSPEPQIVEEVSPTEQTNSPLDQIINIETEMEITPLNLLADSTMIQAPEREAIVVDVAKEAVQSQQQQQQHPTTKPLVLNGLSLGDAQKAIENNEPSILYTIETHEGFKHSSTSIYELWSKVFETVQMARQAHNMPPLPMASLDMISNIQLLGLKTNGLRYLVEQMPGSIKCTKYKPIFNVQLINKDDKSILGSPLHKKGAVRMVSYHGERKPYDMFGWLTSKHRRPDFVEEIPSRKNFPTSLSISGRYRLLKETCKVAVGVYPSEIHGRGLFAKTVIESGDMVIEYAGEVIRSVLTDKREKYYNSKGIGCYMFRIDEDLVVDSTMKGNSARFINHSCDPNCKSKVLEIQGHKHIIIFALRRILCGEELTYDYKFPIEDDKIPCSCGTKRCRKFLN